MCICLVSEPLAPRIITKLKRKKYCFGFVIVTGIKAPDSYLGFHATHPHSRLCSECHRLLISRIKYVNELCIIWPRGAIKEAYKVDKSRQYRRKWVPCKPDSPPPGTTNHFVLDLSSWFCCSTSSNQEREQRICGVCPHWKTAPRGSLKHFYNLA